LCFFVFAVVFLLTGCATDGGAEVVENTCRWGNTYNENNDTSKITISCEIKNNANYKIEKVRMTFEYSFSGGERQQFTVSDYPVGGISGGKSGSVYFSITVRGRVDALWELSMDAEYGNFWDTYSTYFYVFVPILIGSASVIGAFLEGILEFLSEGWWIVLIIAAIAGIVCGFIFWKWQAMLIVLGSLFLTGGVVFLIYKIKERNEVLSWIQAKGNETATEKDTQHKCVNCGGNIKKFIIENGLGESRVEYGCSYCGVMYTKKELNKNKNKEGIIASKEIELTDFEEEYFDACQSFDFRPYNSHTEKQIERRYGKFQERIDNGESLFTDSNGCDNSEDVIEDTRDFLIENINEINCYLNGLSEEEIKKRYEYFLSLHFDNDDE
jgi:hypothetical protein